MAALTQKKTCGQIMDEFKEFMWNPRTREFMGRTASSWVLIVSFYVVFYAFLTAVFSFSMWVMLQTIDEYNPKYSDRLTNPGLMIRPKLDTLEVVYSLTSQNSSWENYKESLRILLEDYNTTVQEERGINCTSGVYNKQEDTGDVRNYPKKACWFLRQKLENCSGIDDPTFGYKDGQPCVLIKMNRVMHFLPEPIPEISLTSITVNCSGKTEENDRLLGNRLYYPGLMNNTIGSIDLMYFPYYGNRAQKNYTQPFVAVKFLNVTRDMDHTVECRVNAANINNQDDRDKFQGRVFFTLRIDS
ncbi:sodium/potassium-transporting ATPase subunit beta-2-like isoform X2 [Ranitomeya imitator]|uniref:sodium/potassium-transporting ATPase subunit beta-2-like isoform X2 n=1 Tax=Ranitomeya imitator TaxID=111125 RepID=UPI0037E940AC